MRSHLRRIVLSGLLPILVCLVAASGIALGNQPPTAPTIEITPDIPADGDDLICNIIVPSTDPDGDPISYEYMWYVDAVLSTVVTATVNDALTTPGETWKCVVYPNDGTDVGPSASATVVVGGAPFDPCAADFNGDGTVNLSDLGTFAADYYSGDDPPRSDFNGDGDVNLIDVRLFASAVGISGC